MKRTKLLIIVLIIFLACTFSACNLDLSLLRPSSAVPSASPSTAPSPLRPEYSEETSEQCPNGHKLVYHEAKPHCLEDGWEEYVTCENCTEYSTFELIPAIGSHDVRCSESTCPYLGHELLHECSRCGYSLTLNKDERYYVSRLSTSQRAAYEKIYESVMNFETEITFSVGELTADEWRTVLIWALCYDSPELQQIESNWSSTTRTSKGVDYVVAVRPSYQMNYATYKKAMKSVYQTFTSWETELRDKTDYEKALFIHDEIAGSATYDADASYSNSPYGVFGTKRARCEGYTEAFTWAMWAQGIPCLAIVGEAGGEPHSWNAVKLDGEFAFVDITWDLGDSFIIHDFFNVDEASLLKTHDVHEDYEALGYPSCTTLKNNFAVKNGLYFPLGKEDEIDMKLYSALCEGYDKLEGDFFTVELRFESKERAEACFDDVVDTLERWATEEKIQASFTYVKGLSPQICLKIIL